MRYDRFARFLNQAGFDVVGYDQWGHGRSEGTRAYVPNFDTYLDDLDLLLSNIRSEVPLFLFGHSMGGLVAVKYCIKKDSSRIDGLITSGAALKLADDVSPILLWLAPILSRLFPKLPTQSLVKKYLSRSQEVVKKYVEDPLIYQGGIKARLAYEMITSIQYVQRGFEQISLPLLALHGADDRIVLPGGTEDLFKKCSSNDKSLQLYDGLYHEILNEPEAENVMADIKRWLSDRV